MTQNDKQVNISDGNRVNRTKPADQPLKIDAKLKSVPCKILEQACTTK